MLRSLRITLAAVVACAALTAIGPAQAADSNTPAYHSAPEATCQPGGNGLDRHVAVKMPTVRGYIGSAQWVGVYVGVYKWQGRWAPVTGSWQYTQATEAGQTMGWKRWSDSAAADTLYYRLSEPGAYAVYAFTYWYNPILGGNPWVAGDGLWGTMYMGLGNSPVASGPRYLAEGYCQLA